MLYSLIPKISENTLFSGVPKDYINKYFTKDSCNLYDLPPNTIAYSSKSSKQSVAIIISGSARVYTDAGSESALIRTLNAGDIFGIANLYDDDVLFPSQIVTATMAQILFIDGLCFKKFIENDPLATKNYIRFISQKIVFLNKKLATLTAGSAEKKLASHICEHNVNGIYTVKSFSELANILQMGRASLYRGIDTLIENEFIEKQGKTIIINNVEALKKYINR